MKEIKGDFWEEAYHPQNGYYYDAICCTTNKIISNDDDLVMGAGIAKDFRDKFKGLNYFWGLLLKRNRKLGYDGVMVEYTYDHPFDYLVAFPTKNNWKDKSDIDLIIKSSKQLKLISCALGFNKILMTQPGCGMGGLKWKDVKPRIEDTLDDRFVVISK